MIYRIGCILVVMALVFPSKGQSEFDLFLQAGVDDASQMIENYFQPVFDGVGYGYTSGWYHTAKPHETLGFDISISANLAFVPKDDFTFTFNNADFTNIQLTNSTSAEVPTAFGPYEKNERPELTFFTDGEEVLRATAPPGAIDLQQDLGFTAVPVPMVQAGIGVVKETDLIVRFIPPLSLGDRVNMSMIGFGVKHNLGQWIKFLDYSGVNISFMAGYSRLNLTADVSEDNDPQTAGNEGVFNLSGTVLQAIISKEYINVFTIYGGIGYSRAGSRTQLLGTFPVDDDFDALPPDPIDLSYGNASMNLTMGLRVRLVALTINTSYTIQDYPVLSLGVGVSVR